MCRVCGCGDGQTRIEGDGSRHHHGHGFHEDHAHHHGLDDGDHRHIHFGLGPAGVQVGGIEPTRLLRIEQDILAKNNGFAAANRARLAQAGMLALNLLSSPGAGKTTLLVTTVGALRSDMPVAVIEGDQETSNDADRIRAAGAPAVQINTGRGCHLDAHMVGHALDRLPLAAGGVLFIENVGNLVCPAGFDLGEARKVAILSVTEGDDKPLKYPDAFAVADLMIVSKIDLLPHVDFDADAAVERAQRVNPALDVLRLSARTGEGMADWLEWIKTAGRAAASASPVTRRRRAVVERPQT